MDSNRYRTSTDYGRRTRPPQEHERHYRLPASKAPPPAPVHAVAPPQHTTYAAPVEAQQQFEPQAFATEAVAPAQAADSTVSIRITLPEFSGDGLRQLLKWRPTTKQVLIAAGILFIFYVGYHMGWRAAKQPPKTAFLQSRVVPWI